jgi:N-acetylmuramic acid 6-phosphate (MurNAc-6-P) etherase
MSRVAQTVAIKNNRQLPVLKYGKLALRTTAGMEILWSFSRVAASTALAEALTAMREETRL